MKKTHLNRVTERICAIRLTDFTDPNAVERYLRDMKAQQKAARTINACRAAVVAFMNWCVRTGRVSENLLSIIPKLDERKGRTRERRALTVKKLKWLLETTAKQDESHGSRYAPRSVVYLTAALTAYDAGNWENSPGKTWT